MKIVANYEEWKSAVQAEVDKLRAVRPYLNKSGEDRLNVMIELLSLSDFCDTAAELVEWIKTREGLNRYENEHLNSAHAQTPIHRLQKIVG